MKRIISSLAIGTFSAVIGGCATTAPPVDNGTPTPVAQQTPSNMPADPYPGRGINLGIGIGSWGGRSGGGIGVGYGW